MKYEIELKFRLEQFHAVESLLRQMGAVERPAVSHVDRYFNHPSRDFRSTDEAFRIRSDNQSNCLTYKGAVIGNVAKTRHEIEVQFEDGSEAAEKLFELVRLLGFRLIREVNKIRRPFALHWEAQDFELALDHVPELGRFIEIEFLAEENEREIAETAVWRLAHALGLSHAESRSYLDLLVRPIDDSLPS